jgi:chemotaxis protein CheC
MDMEDRKLLQKKISILESCSREALLNSASALSQMTGEIIDVENPYVEVIKSRKISGLTDKDSDKISLIGLNIYGRIEGDIYLMLSDDHKNKLIKKVASKNLNGNMSKDLEDSILGEVGNIVAVSYINILGKIFDEVLLPSVPSLSFLESKENLYEMIFGNGRATRYGLTMTSKFNIGNKGIDLLFLLLLNSGSLDFLTVDL